MSHPHYLNNDLPVLVIERRQWIAEMEADHQAEDKPRMSAAVYALGAAGVVVAGLLAWVLW